MIDIDSIAFDKGDGLVPCIVQDATTRTVLMLGYMNSEAVQKTLTEKRVTFFSRSKNRLWTKGETSGNFLNLVSLEKDCDHDTLLARVHPTGPVCHTGDDTCFAEANTNIDLRFLIDVIRDRYEHPKTDSYTTRLFESGINKVAQKVGEEAVELVIEAKDNNRNLFVGEAADLLFHYLVLLQAKGIPFDDVIALLRERHQKK